MNAELNAILMTIESKLIQANGNFIDVIANHRGWLPLQRGESMNVTFGEKRYVIIRIEDIESTDTE